MHKSTPYSIELQVTADEKWHIVITLEVVKRKQLDAANKVRDEVDATVACTLRLTDNRKGCCRIVIEDSWIGSCNTAEWLMDVNGLYSILAIKTGHKGFPKQQLVEKISGECFSSAFMQVDVELECGTFPFYAGGHMDKKPMVLIATCGMSGEAY